VWSFDHIDHHALMDRVRLRVGDAKTLRLIVAFLKAGVLSEGQFARSDAGTPQGGILAPPTQLQTSSGAAV
jgi:retron-type reverse transcriptase